MDIAPSINESEQSWMKWHGIECEDDSLMAIPASAAHMREVVITPVPYAGTEQPYIVQIPVPNRDLPA